ncbi:Hypothetical predicted protein [Scomber scombrus]|uniref:Uncharacterized protein n=1 Tax=Scomber scombrus TaxID=13677 RepID=A0AAV1PPE8_SCOSC
MSYISKFCPDCSSLWSSKHIGSGSNITRMFSCAITPTRHLGARFRHRLDRPLRDDDGDLAVAAVSHIGTTRKLALQRPLSPHTNEPALHPIEDGAVAAATYTRYLNFTQASPCLPNLDFPPPVTDKDGACLYSLPSSTPILRFLPLLFSIVLVDHMVMSPHTDEISSRQQKPFQAEKQKPRFANTGTRAKKSSKAKNWSSSSVLSEEGRPTFVDTVSLPEEILQGLCSSGKENRLAEKVLGNSHRHQLAAYKTWPVTLISRIDFTDYNTGKMSEFGADVLDIKLRPNKFHK